MSTTNHEKLAEILQSITQHKEQITLTKDRLFNLDMNSEEKATVEKCTKEVDASLANIEKQSAEVTDFMNKEPEWSKALTGSIASVEEKILKIEREIQEFEELKEPLEKLETTEVAKVEKMKEMLTERKSQLTNIMNGLKEEQQNLFKLSQEASSTLATFTNARFPRSSIEGASKEQCMKGLNHATQQLSFISKTMNFLCGIAQSAKKLFSSISSKISRATVALNQTDTLLIKSAELKEELKKGLKKGLTEKLDSSQPPALNP
ncbi:MAG: hypothetical protein EBY16_00935 [Gammaproteobacteria bacterium]|nr:hypothetical protein [Gammaproteobacteria bacterium]